MLLWVPISLALIAYALWSETTQDCLPSNGQVTCHNPPIKPDEPLSKGFDRIRCTITWRRALLAALIAGWLILLFWKYCNRGTPTGWDCNLPEGLLYFLLVFTLFMIFYAGIRR